jgi:hypothetical protein
MSNVNPPLPVIGQMDWGEELNTVLADLQERVTVLEGAVDTLAGQPPPLSAVSVAGVASISPTRGPVAGGTTVTVKGSGFNTFGAFQVALGSVGNWFLMTNVMVRDDNTLTAITAPTMDGPGSYQLAVFFNAADTIIQPDGFVYQ